MAKTPLFVAHVRGTVKGGVDIALAPKTLIVGPNGAGKSRVVNAVELALSGYASDVVGRPQMRAGSDLIALAAEGEPLHAVATLSDDRSASFRVERKAGGKTARPSHAPIHDLRVVYPAPMVIDALRGNVQTARTFVLRHAGLALTLPGVVEKIPAKLREAFDALHQQHDQTDPVLALILVRDAAAKAAKATKADAKAARNLVEAAGDLEPSTTEALEAAQAAVRTAAATYEGARNLPDVVDIHALYAEAQEMLQVLQRAEATVAALSEAARQDVEGTSEDAAKARAALHTLLYLTAEHAPPTGQAPCILCGQEAVVEPADYRARAEALSQAGEREEAVKEARQRLPAAQRVQQDAQESAERLVTAYREAHAAQTAPSAVSRSQAVAEAYQSLTTAETRLRDIHQANGCLQDLDRLRNYARDAEATIEGMDDLYAVCTDIVDDLVKQGRMGFIRRVQRYLPNTDDFDLVLRDHKREVCMFGLRRSGTLHTALSGAEWARLTLALGAACIPEGDDVLAILTPEERAYDGVTLAAVMRALSDAPGQVIITSPIKPRGRTPKGWLIIEADPSAQGGDNADQ